jgi:hypothetical protein
MKRQQGFWVGAICLMLSGCGEYQQSVAYEDNSYQGKTDQRHWDNAQFKQDPAAWSEAINQRAQRQNEHPRTSDRSPGQ